MALDSLGSAWVSYYDSIASSLVVANSGTAFTSSNVYVTHCAGSPYYFKKIDNAAPAKDAIQYCFKINYNTKGDPTKAFSQEIRSTVSLR